MNEHEKIKELIKFLKENNIDYLQKKSQVHVVIFYLTIIIV